MPQPDFCARTSAILPLLDPPLETVSLFDETILRREDVIRKRSTDTIRGSRSIMSVILTLIYREFCLACLGEMRKLPGAR